jgi:hypothetical protein
VHLNATITTTREFVPIHTAKVTSTSIVSAEAVDQCIIKNPTYWPAPTLPAQEEPNKPSDGGSRESPAPESPKKASEERKAEAKKDDTKPAASAAQAKKKI